MTILVYAPFQNKLVPPLRKPKSHWNDSQWFSPNSVKQIQEEITMKVKKTTPATEISENVIKEMIELVMFVESYSTEGLIEAPELNECIILKSWLVIEDESTKIRYNLHEDKNNLLTFQMCYSRS
jgi:hypothetical protein